MEIQKTQADGVVIAVLSGKLNAASSEEFAAALDEAVQEAESIAQPPSLRLDFRGVRFLASAGLRVLVATQKRLNSKAGTFTIVNVGEDVKEVFTVTGLDDVFNIVK
ncbi:MAG: STAS domain-containing protein [Treponema sp.]|jgi:anti-sigma B factor antagonist|nr:STAS domain-containing protein [Treponema sp.]